MKILGIDASSNCTGYCIFDDKKLITYGKLKLSNEEKLSLTPTKKIFWMLEKLNKIVDEYSPTMICVEEALPTTVNINTSKTLMRLNGAILEMSRYRGLDLDFISVSEWRKNYGMLKKGTEGRENKKELSVKKANQLYKLNLIYKSKDSKFNDDDISDAILICHYVIHKDDEGFGKN